MRAARATWVWALAAAVALLYPDHIAGAFDGVPLDRAAEALIVGGVVPALWWFYPEFLASRVARASILALIVWRLASSLLLVQDGWCVQFVPATPFAKDAGRVPHAWDLRADWRSFDPACSAIMTRSYHAFEDFPAWFFNLPPPNESWPRPIDIPPGATTPMHVRGYLTTPAPGTLDFEGASGVTGTVSIDGQTKPWPMQVDAGTHDIAIDAVLKYNKWALITKWNGRDLWRSGVTATVHRPSRVDVVARPWVGWIPTVLTIALVGLWAAAAARAVASAAMIAWAAASAVAIAIVVSVAPPATARWVIPAIALAACVPVPPRLRNLAGAYVLVGVPWLAFVLVGGIPLVGRFILYEFGNDYWMYQRFGYRIVMQGYWLEGGSYVFYFQPLYRWITGLLHLVFGDSSVGERFWDGMCLLAGAFFSFRIVRAFAGFRWAIVAAVLPLAVFALGTARYLMGFGLGEISSAGLLSMAALCAMHSRARHAHGLAIGAGALATLAFYTRLNNGIMALGVACFALSLSVPMRALAFPRRWRWRRRMSWWTVAGVWGGVACGLILFAWRTWHYTGVFSLFYGTSRYLLAIWQPNAPLPADLDRLFTNLARVLTVNEPPRFDLYALPVMAGVLVAVSSIAGVPKLRDLPAAAVLFCVSAIAAPFIVYGFAYPGRFSIHLMPITSALTVCAVAGRRRAGWPPGHG
jgi:Dolichyl-phosphate-mannose-protein mannosyltransferase